MKILLDKQNKSIYKLGSFINFSLYCVTQPLLVGLSCCLSAF